MFLFLDTNMAAMTSRANQQLKQQYLSSKSKGTTVTRKMLSTLATPSSCFVPKIAVKQENKSLKWPEIKDRLVFYDALRF